MGRFEGKIVPDSIPHAWRFMNGWLRKNFSLPISHTVPIGTARRELQKSISHQRSNIWVCHSAIGVSSTSSIHRDFSRPDLKNLNTPHWIYTPTDKTLSSKTRIARIAKKQKNNSNFKTTKKESKKTMAQTKIWMVVVCPRNDGKINKTRRKLLLARIQRNY